MLNSWAGDNVLVPAYPVIILGDDRRRARSRGDDQLPFRIPLSAQAIKRSPVPIVALMARCAAVQSLSLLPCMAGHSS